MRAARCLLALAFGLFSTGAQAGPIAIRAVSAAPGMGVVLIPPVAPGAFAALSAPPQSLPRLSPPNPSPLLPAPSTLQTSPTRISAIAAAATAPAQRQAAASSNSQKYSGEPLAPILIRTGASELPGAVKPGDDGQKAIEPKRWSVIFDGGALRRPSPEPVTGSLPSSAIRPSSLGSASALLALAGEAKFIAPAIPYAAGLGVLGGTWLAVRGLDRLLGVVGRWRNWDPASLVVARLGGEVAVWAAGGSLALHAVGLDWSTVFASLGIGGLAVTLATKEFLGNFIRGVVLMVDSPMSMGDLIKIGDKTLRVVDMSFRYVVLQEADGEFLLLTYSSLAAQAFTLIERAAVGKADPEAPGFTASLKSGRRFGPLFWAGAAASLAGAVWLGLALPAALPYLYSAAFLAGTAILERLAIGALRGAARQRGWSQTTSAVARLGTTLGLYGMGLLAALSTAGVPWSILLGGATVLGVAVSVAASDVLSNLIQAVWLLLARPFRVGDRIAVDKSEGLVKDMTLRYVVLEKQDAGKTVSVFVPYSAVAAGPLKIFKNYPAAGHRQ